MIERWRSASMSHRSGDEDFVDYTTPFDPTPLQPAPPPGPAMPMPVPPSPRGEALRSSLLKKPLDSLGAAPAGKPSFPPPPGLPPQRFR